jgi:uncharacterized membrane protein
MKMTHGSKAVLLGTALFCTLSCQEESAEEPHFVPGFVTLGHEVRSFRPCESEEDLWAIDSSGILWDLHQELAPGAKPYEEVFAAVSGYLAPRQTDGFGAEYEGTLVVVEVLYAAGEGLGCETEWTEFSYKASGNEPFWNLDITPQAIELNQLGVGYRSWTLFYEGTDEAAIHLEGRAPEEAKIDVEFRREPCRDSMAGAYFGFSVAVQIGEEELLGCGLRGASRG